MPQDRKEQGAGIPRAHIKYIVSEDRSVDTLYIAFQKVDLCLMQTQRFHK